MRQKVDAKKAIWHLTNRFAYMPGTLAFMYPSVLMLPTFAFFQDQHHRKILARAPAWCLISKHIRVMNQEYLISSCAKSTQALHHPCVWFFWWIFWLCLLFGSGVVQQPWRYSSPWSLCPICGYVQVRQDGQKPWCDVMFSLVSESLDFKSTHIKCKTQSST